MPELVLPTTAVQRSFLAAMAEFLDDRAPDKAAMSGNEYGLGSHRGRTLARRGRGRELMIEAELRIADLRLLIFKFPGA